MNTAIPFSALNLDTRRDWWTRCEQCGVIGGCGEGAGAPARGITPAAWAESWAQGVASAHRHYYPKHQVVVIAPRTTP